MSVRRRRDDDYQKAAAAAARPSPGFVRPGVSQVDVSLSLARAALARSSQVLGSSRAQPVGVPSRGGEPVTLSARMPGRAALHPSQVGKFFSARIERPQSVVQAGQIVARQAARPSVALGKSDQDALARKGVDLMPHDQAQCRKDHRPSSAGGGSDKRAFVPWCEKHK